MQLYIFICMMKEDPKRTKSDHNMLPELYYLLTRHKIQSYVDDVNSFVALCNTEGCLT